jgi:hypothetical protein
VLGESYTSDGFGVYGESPYCGISGNANNSSGLSFGISGGSYSTSGIGVRGIASATTGNTRGVYGSVASPSGYGVFASAPANGVYGHAYSTSGTTYAIYGQAESDLGYGVYGNAPSRGINGIASSTTGVTYGVRGQAFSTSGYGVYGLASATSGTNYGVFGYNSSESGYGVFGQGPRFGVYGISLNIQGRAVTGEATGANSIGVRGIALEANSTGVWGEGANFDFYANGAGTNYGPFTGAHEVKLAEGFPPACKIGLIVSATGKAFVRNDVNGNVSISSTLPEVALCNKANDKAVFGVMVQESPLPKDHWFKENGRFAVVNALGEGRVWVCSANGNIEAGDYITTSDAPGYGQKQADDILHSYTVGKATETVDWNTVTTTIEINGKTYKVYLIAVVYTCG